MDNELLKDQMNHMAAGISTPFDMSEMLSHNIWGAAVTTTRAFEKVTLKIDTNTNRIFVSINLRWWAKFKKFDLLKKAWLRRAEDRIKEHAPEGWRLLIYYEKESL